MPEVVRPPHRDDSSSSAVVRALLRQGIETRPLQRAETRSRELVNTRPRQAVDALEHLSIVAEAASKLSSHRRFTHSRIATAEEERMWTAMLEEEEGDRSRALRSAMDAVEKEETPTERQLSALLVSMLQADVTLMRMSRVFPDPLSRTMTSATNGLRHSPTCELASQLHRAWQTLGITKPTVVAVVQHVVSAVGKLTARERVVLFKGVIPDHLRGTDLPALASFTAEGLVLAEAIETWEPLKRLRTLVAEGRLRLSPEDEKGLLGQAILRRHDGLQGARETGPSTQKTGSSGDGPAETGGSQRAQAGMPFSDLVFDPGDELPFSALPPEEPLFQLAAEVGAEELLQVPGLRTWIEETRGEAPPQKKLNTQMESTDGSDSPSMSGASANSPSYVSTTTSRSPDTDFGPLSDEQFLQLLSDVESKEDDIQTLDVLWQLPDLGYDIGSSWGPASTPAVFAPETPAAPPPQPAQFSDVVASSSPDEGAALRDTNTVHAGRGGSQAGPLAGEEWYRQEMGELQGFRLDSEVPSPQNAREPLDHLLGVSAAPGTSVPHPPSAQQSASGGVATGVLPDEALFAEGMASLRALGLTERSPDAESLLKQTELLRELTASTGARPLSVSGASSRYGSLQVARLRSIRREAAIQLEEAFSAAVAAAHQSGTVYENTRELWSRFRARLRELTTLTLLVVNQLQK